MSGCGEEVRREEECECKGVTKSVGKGMVKSSEGIVGKVPAPVPGPHFRIILIPPNKNAINTTDSHTKSGNGSTSCKE